MKLEYKTKKQLIRMVGRLQKDLEQTKMLQDKMANQEPVHVRAKKVKRVLSMRRRRNISDAYLQGAPAALLAKKYGITTSRVYQIVREWPGE